MSGKRRRQIFLLANILLPIFLGTILYCLISPEVFLVQWLDANLGFNITLENIGGGNLDNLVLSVMFRFVRNHLMDMLWAYALVFALGFLLDMDNKTAKLDLWKIFAITGIFSAITEFCQLLQGVQGTFDHWDILLEILAELLAVFIIKSQWVKYYEEEKEK